MTKLLLLAHESEQPEHVRKVALGDHQPGQWIFLGQDYPQFIKWKVAIGDDLQLISLRQTLSVVSQRLRQPYLNLITSLGLQYNSVAWWASRISERNTLVSSLFLYCCYLQIVREQLINTTKRLCIISESYELLESIANLANDCGYTVHWISNQIPIKRMLFSWLQIIKRILWFLYTVIRRKKTFGDALPTNNKQSIFILSYIDEACLGKDGSFQERYLPGLIPWLEQNKYSVFIIPILSNLTSSYYAIWQWFGRCKQKFINPYRYYHVSDYYFALQEAWKAASIPNGPIYLDNLEVTKLFDGERQHFSFDCLQEILYVRLPMRLAMAGFHIDEFIIPYENIIPEKLFILGYRYYLPATKIVGFQHGALYPMMLCLYVTSIESGFAPLPDRIVCNGDFFREILIREGLPPERTITGPALRYAYLWKLAMTESWQDNDLVDIFVPLPLMINDGVELLTKLIRAFEKLADLRIIIKPHPMASWDILLSSAQINKLPGNFELVEGDMGLWLKRSRLVISLSSTTIYEALASGVPFIVVGRESAIDFNPLGFYENFNGIFYSPDQIREETIRLLALPADVRAHYRQRAKMILQSNFNPISTKSMRVFLDGAIEESAAS